uniref:MYND-type domain-containing protein n=1 Tax=Mycena chlorophos TaxID=658473 RepID=A0ABQ0KWH7_MYCCL|nr:predicted protein [Mycena chlorophos]
MRAHILRFKGRVCSLNTQLPVVLPSVNIEHSAVDMNISRDSALDAFRTTRFQRLHWRVRSHAMAAFQPSATCDQLSRVIQHIADEDVPEDGLLLLLPIPFVHLDPQLIPNVDQLEDLDPELLQRVARALKALELLTNIVASPSLTIPGDIALILLSRVAAWFHFIDNYWVLCVGEDAESTRADQEVKAWAVCLLLLACPDTTHMEFARTTDGMRALLGRALVHSFSHCDLLGPINWHIMSRMLAVLSQYQLGDIENGTTDIDEVVEGTAPQGYRTLALVLAGILLRATGTDPQHPQTQESLSGRLAAIACIVAMLVAGAGCPFEYESSATTSKVFQTFITTMDAVLALRRSALFLLQHDAEAACRPCIVLLIRLAELSLADAEALHVLLRLLVGFDHKGWLDEDICAIAQACFHRVFPQSLLRGESVAKFVEALQSNDISQLRGSDSRLAPLLNAFLWTLRPFQNLSRSMLQACDNLVCGGIHDRDDFRRCGRCFGAYYCSPACQKVDWDAGHRRFCSFDIPWALTSATRTMTHSGRHRLRALVQHCYESRYDSILTHQIIAMVQMLRAGQEREPVVVIFDLTRTNDQGEYCVDAVRPAAHICRRSSLLPLEIHSEWANVVDRARLSQGKLSIHLVRVRIGAHIRTPLVPLRMGVREGSGLLDMLWAAAGRINETGNDVSDEVLEDAENNVRLQAEVNAIRRTWPAELGIH